MTDEAAFREHRTWVVKLAYRMLGSASEAEDVAQDAFVRLGRVDISAIESVRAWLTRTATRLCLDRLKSAERARTTYTGVTLPEPLLAHDDERGRLDDTLSMALLATLQRLEPAQRAAFLLHDVFDYPFEDVAAVLDLRVDHCRQLASRARRNLALEQVRSDASPEAVVDLTEAFFAAIEGGDMAPLEQLLTEDVELRSDGGGKVPAANRPIEGRDAVLRFIEKAIAPSARPGWRRRRVWFNGSPGVVVSDADGQPVTAFHFLVVDGRIRGIYAQRDPDKLARLRP